MQSQVKPFHRVHSVAKLFSYLEQLVNQHAPILATFCHTDWTAIPNEAHGWIRLIEETDATSTFFRYPNPQARAGDHAKSSFQTSSPEELIAAAIPSGPPVKATVILDESDSVVETFRLNSEVMPEIQAALRSVAELLEAAHFGMRIELAGGW